MEQYSYTISCDDDGNEGFIDHRYHEYSIQWDEEEKQWVYAWTVRHHARWEDRRPLCANETVYGYMLNHFHLKHLPDSFTIDKVCRMSPRELQDMALNLKGSNVNAAAYGSTQRAITRIPIPLKEILLAGRDVARGLRASYLADLNVLPFAFSEEKNHVWQVLGALEAIQDNDYDAFSKDKEEDKLDERIFDRFVLLANNLRDDHGLAEMWIATFLHDIAKYSVQNADHARISGDLVRDPFVARSFGLTEESWERIAWVVGNHDAVGNIVSSAERAPRCLTERLVGLPLKEKQARLRMLILLSLCDLRGTENGRYVNDDNAELRFRAADPAWLEEKERDLFAWRRERLARASTPDCTQKKRSAWDTAFRGLPEETKRVLVKQLGSSIKVFTNLLYLALGLEGEELVKLFAMISLAAENATKEKPNPDFQVDFTRGGERGQLGPVINGFRTRLAKVRLVELTLANTALDPKNPVTHGIPMSVGSGGLVIDSKRMVCEDETRNG